MPSTSLAERERSRHEKRSRRVASHTVDHIVLVRDRRTLGIPELHERDRQSVPEQENGKPGIGLLGPLVPGYRVERPDVPPQLGRDVLPDVRVPGGYPRRGSTRERSWSDRGDGDPRRTLDRTRPATAGSVEPERGERSVARGDRDPKVPAPGGKSL
jgi:hypothetical protein